MLGLGLAFGRHSKPQPTATGQAAHLLLRCVAVSVAPRRFDVQPWGTRFGSRHPHMDNYNIYIYNYIYCGTWLKLQNNSTSVGTWPLKSGVVKIVHACSFCWPLHATKRQAEIFSSTQPLFEEGCLCGLAVGNRAN